MYVRDPKPLTRRFDVRCHPRLAEVECLRCHRRWTTGRLHTGEPRLFWSLEGPRRRPVTAEKLEAHAKSPH
jgi:hypothetical protein